MSKMVVVVFDDEQKTYEGSRALRELHNEGSVSVYAAAIAERNPDGQLVVRDSADEGPIGAAIGMMTGALIGVFAGAPGVAVGAAGGSLVGATVDLFNFGVGADFVEELNTTLEPGSFALVAEIDENWETPLDTRMQPLGGTVIRRHRMDIEDEQIEREIATIERGYADLEAELDEAGDEARAAVKKKLDATRAKLDELRESAVERHDRMEDEMTAKLEAVEDQMVDAAQKFKDQLAERKQALIATHESRSSKLKALFS